MQWRAIPSFPDYEASESGDIRRPGNAPLRQFIERNGYPTVTLWVDGKTNSQWTHRLVCEAFHGPAPFPGAEAAHENGTLTDIRESNLSWKTKAANAADKKRHGTENIGERNGGATLTEDQVREIRIRHANAPRSSGGKRARKGTLQSLSREFGITPNAVLAVVTRRRWSHIR